MNKARLLEIVSAHPWQTRLSLVKLCAPEIKGVDSAEQGSLIGDMLSELRELGKITSAGKARGTRYAVAGAEPFETPKITDDQRAAVLAAVNGGASASIEIVSASGVDIDTARPILRELIEAGKIDKTGSTKSTRYWPKGEAPQTDRTAPAPAESADKKPSRKKPPPRMMPPPQKIELGLAPTQVLPSRTLAETSAGIEEPYSEAYKIRTQIELPPKVDPVDALRRTFSSLPRRSASRRNGEEVDSNVFALDEVLRMAEDYGASRHEVSRLIQDRVLGTMGDGHRLGDGLILHSQMRYDHKRGYPGWSAYVWRPTKDDDPRPELYLPITKSTPPLGPKPKDEAKAAGKKAKKGKR